MKNAWKISVFVVVIVVACACFWVSHITLITVAAEPLARSLAPPEYPESDLVTQWYSGGPDTMWDRRTYHTSDGILKVLKYMESNMPGFEQAESNTTGEIVYFNGECLDNWLGSQMALINMGDPDYIGNPSLPCVSVWVYQDTDLSSGTYIRVWLDWPAT